jgi:hypothetical protein
MEEVSQVLPFDTADPVSLLRPQLLSDSAAVAIEASLQLLHVRGIEAAYAADIELAEAARTAAQGLQ